MGTGDRSWRDRIADRIPVRGMRGEVTRAAGLTPANLTRYLTTGKGLSAASLERLARAVGLDLEEQAPHREPTQTEKASDPPLMPSTPVEFTSHVRGGPGPPCPATSTLTPRPSPRRDPRAAMKLR